MENDIFPKINNLREKRSEGHVEDEYNQYEDELADQEERLDELNKKLEYYDHKISKKGLSPDDIEDIFQNINDDEDISSYKNYTEDELNDKIKHLKEEIREDKDEIDELNMSLKMDEK